MSLPTNIYDFIEVEEGKYDNTPTSVVEGWEWSMSEHINTSILYKNGRLLTGNSDDKPVKNIVLPILNLEYRAEDIDVKDINLYVDDPSKHHLSFLIKKYHDDVFVIENNIDDFIDEEKEEMIDLGGVLLKDLGEAVPEIVHMQDIAFCNQNDMLSSPIGIKYLFSPDQLKDMEKRGWGETSNGATADIDTVIGLAIDDSGDMTGKDIAVYLVNGTMPNSYLEDIPAFEQHSSYSKQFHVVCFYKDEEGDRQGIHLFRKETNKDIFKLQKRDKIHNRALGRGGVEELFEPQVWTTYTQIQKKNMLDAASKVILQTDDEGLKGRHPTGLKGMNNLEIVTVEKGSTVGQIDNYPRNIALFDAWDVQWEQYGRGVGAAQEAISGDAPKAGTPLGSMQIQSAESHSLHQYRIGKHAKFLEELYRDWFIPYMIKQITKGTKFLSTLDLEEMRYVADRIVTRKANEKVIETILEGKLVDMVDLEEFKQKERDIFMKDNKKFIEIIKDEFKSLPIAVKIDISGKQKDLSLWTEKLLGVFRQIIGSTDPQTGESILSNPSFAKLFNQIVEASGLSPVDFEGFTTAQPNNQAVEQATPQPQQIAQ